MLHYLGFQAQVFSLCIIDSPLNESLLVTALGVMSTVMTLSLDFTEHALYSQSGLSMPCTARVCWWDTTWVATLPGICQGKPLGLMTLPLDFTEHALSVNVSPASEPLQAIGQFRWGC